MRTLLDITTEVKATAVAYGAYFDPGDGAWVIDGAVPEALRRYIVGACHALGLWMNGAFVGTWRVSQDGHVLEYSDSWVANSAACPISLSLPLIPSNPRYRGDTVRNFFENLLPDSDEIRERLARRYGAKSTDAFDLLRELGHDCAGALQVLPMGTRPRRATDGAVRLSDAQLADVLHETTQATVPERSHDLRFALAGAQEKTALQLSRDGHWCLPSTSTATTHIFKLPMGLVGNMKLDLRSSVGNEWLCSIILRAYGLPVASCTPLQFAKQPVLAVERFDRSWEGDGAWPARLHQEDLCQAFGVAPAGKYEADGGPGIDGILRLLSGSITPDLDKRTFFLAQVLFWMLCATDGHAKNFSLRIHPGGRYQLAPLYDVLSAHPFLGAGPNQISPYKAKMAMAVRSSNVHWRMREILRRHWIALGQRHGVVAADGGGPEVLIDELIGKTSGVITSLRMQLPSDFPVALADSIFGGLESAARRLARG